MKKYIYAIIEFNNDDYIRTIKGYTDEEIAITKCNELNRYADDLSDYNDAFELHKDSNEKLISLYEEQDVVWKEFDKFNSDGNKDDKKEYELSVNFLSLTDKIRNFEKDLKIAWEIDNPFHSDGIDNGDTIYSVVTIEMEKETLIQRLLNFFKNKS